MKMTHPMTLASTVCKRQKHLAYLEDVLEGYIANIHRIRIVGMNCTDDHVGRMVCHRFGTSCSVRSHIS